MKKTRIQYLKQAILKNIVSFCAVAFIAAVSIAIYFGIQSATTAIYRDADKYLISNHLETMEIACANGITSEDIEAIAQWKGVDTVEGGYTAMVMTQLEQEKITVQALSICKELNVPEVLEGDLPVEKDQVALEQQFAQKAGFQVGDVLTLEHDGQLLEETFQITGIINQPAFCCALGAESRGISTAGLGYAEYYIGLPMAAYNESFYDGCFTTAYLHNEELGELAYFSGDEQVYEEQEALLIKEYEELAAERAKLRHEELLEQARPAIAAGLMSEEDIPLKEWIISGRNDVGDLRGVKGLVDSVNGISYSLSVIFLFVAVVVCYAAVSRMIEEQKTLIGVQKAMGFTPREIRTHYMVYNFLCAGCGILAGWFLGAVLIQNIVLYILAENYLLGSIPPVFAAKEAFVSAALCLVIFLVTTYVTCVRLSKEPATKLLRGEMPVRQKPFFFEKWKLYRRMKLYSRTMIKNVLNDTGRMLTTIVGVVGCISLLVICLSLKMAIDGAFDKQFEEYFHYDNRLVIDTGAADVRQFTDVLEEEGIPYMQIQDKLRAFRVDGGKWMNSHIVAAEDMDRLRQFMVLEDAATGEAAETPEDGVLVSEKCAEIYGLSVGSVVEIMDSQGNSKEFHVVGVVEHYLRYHLFVTTSDHYEAQMGEAADESVFLLQGDISGLYEKVRDLDGFLALKDNSGLAENADAIYMAIAVCLALSVAMAFLVLLNQITMHINRKSRELAVMRVNGYTLKETKAYIYKDNIVLTVLGLILGSGVGMGLAYVVIIIMEREPSRYIHTPSLLACLYACGVGALFSLIVNVIALRRIDQLNLRNVNGN